MVAQTNRRIYADLERTHVNLTARALEFSEATGQWAVGPDAPNRLDVLEHIHDEIREWLLSRSHASRSTSVTSNAVEDVERDTKIKFLRYSMRGW